MESCGFMQAIGVTVSAGFVNLDTAVKPLYHDKNCHTPKL